MFIYVSLERINKLKYAKSDLLEVILHGQIKLMPSTSHILKTFAKHDKDYDRDYFDSESR